MTLMTRRQTFALAAGATALAALPARAANERVFSTLLGGAIRGYDPVAYFTEAAPVKGSRSYTSDWAGATWRFASAANKERFDADPERWAPQYGGWCAWAMAQGNFAPIDPDNWRVVDEKLYLNYNDEIQRRWEQDIAGFIEAADARYPTLIG